MRVPIRLRLTLISAGLMAAVLVALAAFLVTRLEADLIATVDAGLRSRASVLLDRIGEGGGVSSSSLTEGDEAFAQLLASDGSIVVSSRGVTDPILSSDEVSAVENVDFLDRTVDTGDEPVEGRLLVTGTGDGDVLVVGASLEDQRDAITGLASLLLIGIPAAVALASIVGWIVAGAALRPVERLRQEADAISASEPGRRLPVPGDRRRAQPAGREPEPDARAPRGGDGTGAPVRRRCKPRTAHAARQPPGGGRPGPATSTDRRRARGGAAQRARGDRAPRSAGRGPARARPPLGGWPSSATRTDRPRPPRRRDRGQLRRARRGPRRRARHGGGWRPRGPRRWRAPEAGARESPRQRPSIHAARRPGDGGGEGNAGRPNAGGHRHRAGLPGGVHRTSRGGLPPSRPRAGADVRRRGTRPRDRAGDRGRPRRGAAHRERGRGRRPGRRSPCHRGPRGSSAAHRPLIGDRSGSWKTTCRSRHP